MIFFLPLNLLFIINFVFFKYSPQKFCLLFQHTSRSELILHLMHLQPPRSQSLSSCPHSCNSIFKHYIFLNLYYFSFFDPHISRYVNIYDLNPLLLSINKNNIRSSSFNLDITLDCKFSKNLVHFFLNNST